jgi:magnesium-protoporphyrin O-methyltransferase
MPRLTGAAADHARRLLVLSFPEDRWWVRAGLAAGNLLLWLTRAQFQVFVHEPGEIFAVCARAGLQPAEDQRGVLWRVVALERSAAA